MLDRYIINLYKQYCEARGIFCNPKVLSQDFIEWVALNKLLTKKYADYLNFLGYFSSKTIAEVGKGKYDSIATTAMSVISPYASTMKLKESSLFVVSGVPFVDEVGKLLLPQQDVLLTHNPYEEMKIINWSDIHNLGQYNISIGMFGSIHDEDFSKKIKLIEEISKRMTEDYVVDYETDSDKYFCTLNSKRNVKVKTLIR